MDDLISRKAVRDGMMKYGFIAPDMTVHEFVEDELSSVPAVPLDKLCEWLSKYSVNIPCETCRNISNSYCMAIGDVDKPCPNEAEDWQRVIKEWMEGLDDHR